MGKVHISKVKKVLAIVGFLLLGMLAAYLESVGS